MFKVNETKQNFCVFLSASSRVIGLLAKSIFLCWSHFHFYIIRFKTPFVIATYFWRDLLRWWHYNWHRIPLANNVHIIRKIHTVHFVWLTILLINRCRCIVLRLHFRRRRMFLFTITTSTTYLKTDTFILTLRHLYHFEVGFHVDGAVNEFNHPVQTSVETI